eukprot:TRINITY_DN29315_c0_g1_i1.p2 TRINITY_DN29315_c0_g1~~TRINITY_DN29315_c0_g1_i1.p2  ORF type:complete len:189 (+),score=46.15 TRINITY_DN29315_c0_g1_i1:38-568(+)
MIRRTLAKFAAESGAELAARLQTQVRSRESAQLALGNHAQRWNRSHVGSTHESQIRRNAFLVHDYLTLSLNVASTTAVVSKLRKERDREAAKKAELLAFQLFSYGLPPSQQKTSVNARRKLFAALPAARREELIASAKRRQSMKLRRDKVEAVRMHIEHRTGVEEETPAEDEEWDL